MTREVKNGKVAWRLKVDSVGEWTTMSGKLFQVLITRLENKKLSYRRGTARCVLSVVILSITTQQCRNYLYDKS